MKAISYEQFVIPGVSRLNADCQRSVTHSRHHSKQCIALSPLAELYSRV